MTAGQQPATPVRGALGHTGLWIAAATGVGSMTAVASVRGVAAELGVTVGDLGLDSRGLLAMAAVWLTVPFAIVIPFLVVVWFGPLDGWAFAVGLVVSLVPYVLVHYLVMDGYGNTPMTVAMYVFLPIVLVTMVVAHRMRRRRTEKAHDQHLGRVEAAIQKAKRATAETELATKESRRQLLLPSPNLAQAKAANDRAAEAVSESDRAFDQVRGELDEAQDVTAASAAMTPRYPGVAAVVTAVGLLFVAASAPIIAHEASQEWATTLLEAPAEADDGPRPVAVVLPTAIGTAVSADGTESCVMRVGGDVFVGANAVVVEHGWSRFTIGDCVLVDVPFRD